MNRRLACLLVIVSFAWLSSSGEQSQQSQVKTQIKNAAHSSNVIASRKSILGAPPTQIGFLSALQVPGGGATYSSYPAVQGDFLGNGHQDAITLVNVGTNGSPQLSLSAVLSLGNGTFTTKLTHTSYTVFNPLWTGSFGGGTGDDVLVLNQSTGSGASVDIWISNGDGTFTQGGNYPLATGANDIIWATVTPLGGHASLVAVDSANPGNVWTLAGVGNGTFNAATSVAITGQLRTGLQNPAPTTFNAIAFGDFNNDGILDFAGPAASNNQIHVYLGTGSGYQAPIPLTTSDTAYQSCFVTSGDLSGHTGDADIIAANCYSHSVTVYVNSGTFAQGVYYPAGSVDSSLNIADIDGDGKNDVVSCNWQGGDVTVLLGNGDGTLDNSDLNGFAVGGAAHINAPLGPALVSDFNGDGKLDLLLQDSEFSLVYLENNSPGIGSISFHSAVDYRTGLTVANPYSVGLATGDFNKDGVPDFVAGNAASNTPNNTGIAVYLGNASKPGALEAGTVYGGTGTTFNFEYVAVADFDGDGNLDIAAADNTNGLVQIFLGDGSGGFTPYGTTFSVGSGVSALGIVTADFNGDGKPDLAVVTNTGSASASVAVLLNHGSTSGNPNFSAAAIYNLPASELATEITAANLGNGHIDLVVPSTNTSTQNGSVNVFLGSANGVFTAGTEFQLAGNGSTYHDPYYAAVGDLNGDGKVDLAITIQDHVQPAQQGMLVAFGNGNGTFQTPVPYPTSTQLIRFDDPAPGYAKIADMNGDGHADIVYTNTKYGTVGILYNVGSGTFYSPIEFAGAAKVFDFALTDINGDGTLDVVASTNATDAPGVSVLLNTSGDTIATPTSSPNPSTAGSPVTFNAVVTGSHVYGVQHSPTGSVTFFVDGTGVGSGTLSGDTASLSYSGTTAGSHNITAQYNGDTNYLKSAVSSPLHQTVVAAPDYTLASNPTSQSVQPGSSANYALTVTPTNSYDGTVTFTCSGLPSGAACKALQIASPYAAGTLTITTTGPTASLTAPQNLPRHGEQNLFASLTGLGLLGMVFAGDWKKRNRRRLGILLGVFALVMILALVGCGGGSSSGGGGGGGGGGNGGGGTPAGTYTVKVTATGTAGTNGGNTSPHTLNVTLVVQ